MIWLLFAGCTGTESLPEGPLRTTSFEGQTREYRLFVPESEGPHPVLIALHGGGGADESMLAPGKRIGMTSKETATALITPIGARGDRGQWAPEDARFLIHILDEVSTLTPIQTDRVHLIGFSGGGRLGYQTAAEYPDRIHAVATLHARAGVRGPDGQWVAPFDPNATGASGVHIFNFFGGTDPNRVENETGLGQEETLALWERANGATREAPVSLVHAPDEVRVWMKVNPATGTSVVGAVEPDLGHEWPAWNITSDIFDFFNLP
jgi:polyhydroxybutyrate depolymerase